MEVDGQLVMVLELLSGHTLREELTKRGKLPWHEALEVISKIAEALEAAHSQEPPIIHRDLKPENVMLTDGGGASGLKVMDFGIAKVLAAAHATNTQSIGTLQYMSPEQIDARTIDARSDLYSLGLIFYELIVGAPPFHSASPRELLNLQCTAEAPDLDEEVRRTLPRGVEELLFGLLEKAPADRPADAAEVIAKLAPFRAAEPAPRRSRARATPAPSSVTPSSSSSDEGAAAEDATEEKQSGAKGGGDTLHSTPHKAKKSSGSGSGSAKEKPAVRLDTIQLVERSGEGRDLSTGKAVLVILGLSIFAGVATYMVRAQGKGTSDVPSATASATQSPAP